MESNEARKKTIYDSMLNAMYRVFFDYNVVDMRDEMRRIMVREIYQRPNHEKSVFFPNFADQDDAKRNFCSTRDTVFRKLGENNYEGLREDIYKLGDAMYFIPRKQASNPTYTHTHLYSDGCLICFSQSKTSRRVCLDSSFELFMSLMYVFVCYSCFLSHLTRYWHTYLLASMRVSRESTSFIQE